MATPYLLPGYGVIIETEEGASLLPGYGVIIQTEAAGGASPYWAWASQRSGIIGSGMNVPS